MRSRTRRRPTSSARSRRQGGHAVARADGPARLRRRRLRQDRGRHPRGLQGGEGRQAGRRARPHDRPGTQHHATFAERLAAFPVDVEDALPVPRDKEQRVVDGSGGHVDIVIGTHRLLARHQVQGPRPGHRR